MWRKIYTVSIVMILSTFGCQNDFDSIRKETIQADTDEEQTILGLAQIENAIVGKWQQASLDLYNSAVALASLPTDEALANSQVKWSQARDPWENNESFAFGPVATEGIDANTDDWPFDVTAFNAVLQSNQQIDEAMVQQMTTTTKGFHGIEYLLFGENGNKKISDFSHREFQVLIYLSKDLLTQANRLASYWTPGSTSSFYDDFIAAGSSGSSYLSTADALSEVLGSMVDILTELPDSKIRIPLTLQNSAYAESRFSDYSWTDYRNNLSGVYAVYLGKYGDIATEKNFSSLVANKNSALNEKLITQFKLCLALMDLVQPSSFNQALTTKQEQLQEIITELEKLTKILNEEVRKTLSL
ncbi:MAG: hypothetical protein JSS79_04445 [Bacteroidetes bacterium]|nr:hypothetical protein [Bacteroidota bacterium]